MMTNGRVGIKRHIGNQSNEDKVRYAFNDAQIQEQHKMMSVGFPLHAPPTYGSRDGSVSYIVLYWTSPVQYETCSTVRSPTRQEGGIIVVLVTLRLYAILHITQRLDVKNG